MIISLAPQRTRGPAWSRSRRADLAGTSPAAGSWAAGCWRASVVRAYHGQRSRSDRGSCRILGSIGGRCHRRRTRSRIAIARHRGTPLQVDLRLDQHGGLRRSRRYAVDRHLDDLVQGGLLRRLPSRLARLHPAHRSRIRRPRHLSQPMIMRELIRRPRPLEIATNAGSRSASSC